VRITIVRRASGVEEDRLPGRRPLAGGDAGWLDRSIGVEQQGAGRTGAAARAVFRHSSICPSAILMGCAGVKKESDVLKTKFRIFWQHGWVMQLLSF